MLRSKKALLPVIVLAALFMTACEGPVMDNDGFGGALNAARAISKSEEEITQPQLVWNAGSASSITTQDMLALDFGYYGRNTPVFVAGGRVGEIDYSTDGVTWTQANNNGGFGYAPGT
jgi:hypothetical protein